MADCVVHEVVCVVSLPVGAGGSRREARRRPLRVIGERTLGVHRDAPVPSFG